MLLLLPALLLFASDDVEESLKRVADVFAVVEREAADPVSADKAFYQGAIPGLMRRLDPHSVFFDPGQFQQLKELENSTRKGFGTVVSVLPGRVIILQTLPNTPSAKSGLSPGDEIVAINGIPLGGLSMEQLIGLLGETRQRRARLEIRRSGNIRLLPFELTPEDVDSPSVERIFHPEPGIGFLRITSFDAKTGALVKEAIEKLGGSKLKGLVLDLRNNPGGLMPPALETAALFLKPGQRILSVRGRRVDTQDVNVPDGAEPYGFPVAVLMNEKSASGSEIVAGALQDHDRGTIVGEPSFGKGLVQSVYPLSQETGIALTTAHYHTPSGRSIQRRLQDSQLDAATGASALEYRTDSGRTVRGGGGILPDIAAAPPSLTRLSAFLDASGAFPSFATEYLRRHKIDETMTVTGAALDEFQRFLSERKVLPGVGEWLANREWIRSRLHQEIFNQAFGVEKGDEIELSRDPVVRSAIDALKSGSSKD